MLKFYGLEDDYLKSKLAATAYEFKDKKFSDYFMVIHEITMDFNEDINTILREANNLNTYNKYFDETIDTI